MTVPDSFIKDLFDMDTDYFGFMSTDIYISSTRVAMMSFSRSIRQRSSRHLGIELFVLLPVYFQ